MSREISEPDFGLLLAWLEKRLPAEQAADMAAQVAAGSPTLQHTVAWLRAYLGVAERVHLASSPELQDRLVGLFEAQVRQNRPSSRLRRYFAALTTDSRSELNLTGMRGGDVDVPRQLLFATEVADITLNLNTNAGKFDLRGQVFPNADTLPHGLVVQLLQDLQEVEITTTSETGRFAFANLRPGVYEIVAVGDQFEVHTAAIALDAPDDQT